MMSNPEGERVTVDVGEVKVKLQCEIMSGMDLLCTAKRHWLTVECSEHDRKSSAGESVFGRRLG